MRYQILKVSDQAIQIHGYDDGAPWLVIPTGETIARFGLFSGDNGARAWTMSGGGYAKRLVVLDLDDRRQIGDIHLDHADEQAIVSSDGRYIYVLGDGLASGEKTLAGLRLDVIDVRTVRRSATHHVPDHRLSLYRCHPVVLPNGRVRVPAIANDRQALVTLNPVSGDYELDLLPASINALHSDPLWLSPSGRYVLRQNLATLPVHTEGERQWYGVTVQLWQTSPLRYLRTLTCAWLLESDLDYPPFKVNNVGDEVSELMTAVGSAMAGELPKLGASRKVAASWQDDFAKTMAGFRDEQRAIAQMPPPLHQIVEAMKTQPIGSLSPPELTAVCFPSDPFRKPAAEAHWEFAQLPSDFTWQPDETAFWCQVYGFWACVDLKGNLSPRIRLERAGLNRTDVRRLAIGPRHVEALNGRTARFFYAPFRQGGPEAMAVIEGAAVEQPWFERVIPTAEDRVESGLNSELTSRTEADIERQTDRLRTLRVPLSNRTRLGCLAAIKALTAQFADDTLAQRFPSELSVVFELPDGTEIDAKSFFGHVESQGPGGVLDLRMLLETALDVEYASVWAENGAFLQHAMKALVVLDPDALPVLRRYPIDLFHNSYPGDHTLPAMVKAHGWNDERISFVLDEVVLNYFGYEWCVAIWRKHGLSKAVAQRFTPEAFVERLLENVDDIPGDDDDLVEFIEEIGPLSAWEREVFLLLGADIAGADIPPEAGPDGRDRPAERAKASEIGHTIRGLRQAMKAEGILDAPDTTEPTYENYWLKPLNLLAAAAMFVSGLVGGWNAGFKAWPGIAALAFTFAIATLVHLVAVDKTNARVQRWLEEARLAAIQKVYAVRISRIGALGAFLGACTALLVIKWNIFSNTSRIATIGGLLLLAAQIIPMLMLAGMDERVKALRRALLLQLLVMFVVGAAACATALAIAPTASWWLRLALLDVTPRSLAIFISFGSAVCVTWLANSLLAKAAAPGAAKIDVRSWGVVGIYAGSLLRGLASAR